MGGSWARNVEPFFPANVAALFGRICSVLGEKEVCCIFLAHFWSCDAERRTEVITGEDCSSGGFGTRGLDDFPVHEPSVSAKLVSLADGEFGRTSQDDEQSFGCVETFDVHFEPVMVEPHRTTHP